MKLPEVRARAVAVKIEPGRRGKKSLIHAIQEAEGYTQCYGKFAHSCPYVGCCWRKDCARDSREPSQERKARER